MRFGHRGVLVNEEQFKESPLLTVRATEVAGVVVIVVEGEIDVDTADVVLDAVRVGFGSEGPALVADLTLVSFFGSTGISTLISAHELADGQARSCTSWHRSVPSKDRCRSRAWPTSSRCTTPWTRRCRR